MSLEAELPSDSIVETERKKDIIEDPRVLIVEFRQSDPYKKMYDEYFREKTLKFGSDITKAERKIKMRRAFESDQLAKDALIRYAKQMITFRYNSDYYSPDTATSISKYVDTVRIIRETVPKDQEDFLRRDEERSRDHREIAKRLFSEGIVPNEKLGKTVANLILIDLGLNTFEDASEPDINRVYRKLGLEIPGAYQKYVPQEPTKGSYYKRVGD